MQTLPDNLSDGPYDRVIRSAIGEALRTLFVPTEPPPKRLLELLHVLDQPKRGDANRADEELEEELRKQPKATGVVDRVKKGQARGSKEVPRTDEPPALSVPDVDGKRAARAEHLVEKIPDGYVVRDADGQALVYVYCKGSQSEAMQANVLTEDEARWIAINVAKLRRGD